MKKVLIFLLALSLYSCKGTNNDACLKSVKETFPNAKVYAPYQGSNYHFIVIDSSKVLNVETGNMNSTKVTKVEILELK